MLTVLSILGCVALLLYGMRLLSEGMQIAAGRGLRERFSAVAGDRTSAFATGLTVTCLTQTSSATAFAVVSLAHARIVDTSRALALLMGANLGTTLKFWLLAALGWQFDFAGIALPGLAVGVLLHLSRHPVRQNAGQILIGFGLIFLSINLLRQSLPLGGESPESWRFLNDFAGQGLLSLGLVVLAGVGMTVLLQSSSVMVALTVALAAQGWIDLPVTAALVLGENLGTTIKVVLASLVGNRAGRRVAWGHFLFNAAGLLWAFPTLPLWLPLLQRTLPGGIAPGLHPSWMVAAIHTGFNLLTAACLLPAVPWISRLLHSWIPDRTESPSRSVPSWRAPAFAETGEVVLLEAEAAVRATAESATGILREFAGRLTHPSRDSAHALASSGDLLRTRAESASALLRECTGRPLGQESTARSSALGEELHHWLALGENALALQTAWEEACQCGHPWIKHPGRWWPSLARHTADSAHFAWARFGQKPGSEEREAFRQWQTNLADGLEALRQELLGRPAPAPALAAAARALFLLEQIQRQLAARASA